MVLCYRFVNVFAATIWNVVWATAQLLDNWHILARSGTVWIPYRAGYRASAETAYALADRQTLPAWCRDIGNTISATTEHWMYRVRHGSGKVGVVDVRAQSAEQPRSRPALQLDLVTLGRVGRDHQFAHGGRGC